MYNRAKEEREEFIKSNNYSMFAYTDDELNEELKSSLQDLLDSNICLVRRLLITYDKVLLK